MQRIYLLDKIPAGLLLSSPNLFDFPPPGGARAATTGLPFLRKKTSSSPAGLVYRHRLGAPAGTLPDKPSLHKSLRY